MTHPDWASLRNTTIDRFNGETPHPATEQDIIRAYELHPDAVEKAIGAVAAELHAGAIHSGWGILRHRAEAILKPPRNPTVKHGRQREKQLQRAEQWIRNAGMHFDSWSEVEDVLRTDFGISDDELPALGVVWGRTREIGERLEREAEQRAEAWKASRAALASTKSPSKSVESTVESASLGGKAHEQSADDDFPPPQNSGAAEAGTSSAGSGTPASGVPAPEHDFPATENA